ncbi:MAG: cellulase family glycosylhydrolase [Chlamydiales bacterium]|nr:cellulase family glycosylhydrolase [Chlamydiales bacterium]
MTKLYYLILCLSVCFCPGIASEKKMDYWGIQRKGANFFNQSPSEDWFTAAKAVGIQFARLAPDKWSCEKKDFLIGDADAFVGIPPSDLEILKTTLNQAQDNNVRVVITLLSLPGSRWRQNNHGQDDLRIWEHNDYQSQAISFWRALAEELKDHPAIVGYNILNEPHPECLFGIHDYKKIDFKNWYETVKDSRADLNIFYRKIVSAIREVDSDTPIIIDTGLHATPGSISYLTPIEDDNILYSFHMYEPYAYTTRKINNKRFSFPGHLPIGHDPNQPGSKTTYWDNKRLEQFFNPVLLWQKQFNIPSSQILVGEFGCDRTAQGADQYLSHLISIFNRNNWHWAFYSFREDCWDSMDYELGSGELHWQYWDAAEKGANLDQFRKNNAIFDVIKKALENSPN